MVLDSATERMAKKLIETTDEGVILAASFLILSRNKKHEPVVVEDRYYTLKDLMEIWRCSYSYLSRQINGGKLKAIKFGKSYRVSNNERIRFEMENQRRFDKN